MPYNSRTLSFPFRCLPSITYSGPTSGIEQQKPEGTFREEKLEGVGLRVTAVTITGRNYYHVTLDKHRKDLVHLEFGRIFLGIGVGYFFSAELFDATIRGGSLLLLSKLEV